MDKCKRKYRKNKGCKYRARKLDLQGNFLGEITAREAIYLRDNYPSEYSKYRFESTHSNPEKRRKVILVLNSKGKSFFKYKTRTWKCTGGGEKLPHKIAKYAILAAINNLAIEDEPICLHDNKTNKDLYFWPIKADVEVNTPFVTNEDNPNALPYSADVGMSFYKSEPEELLEKYQGVLAIEVADSHYIEPDKINDFEAHGIAIFEYKLNRKKWGLKEKMNDDEIEGILETMEERFQDVIFGKIQSDPVSIKYANEKMIEAQKEAQILVRKINEIVEEKEQEIKEVENRERFLLNANNANLDKIRRLEEENSMLLNKVNDMRKELSQEKNKNLFQYLVSKLKNK